MHHYLTLYIEHGKRYAESWLQISIFGKPVRFSRRKVELRDEYFVIRGGRVPPFIVRGGEKHV